MGVARASDHQDNPLVEVNPAMDMTDVYTFPRSSADRIALVRLTTRGDVYGYDLLAWAQHKRGRDREAAVAMTAALSQGTQDAQLFYHASEIERSLGHRDAPRRCSLERSH